MWHGEVSSGMAGKVSRGSLRYGKVRHVLAGAVWSGAERLVEVSWGQVWQAWYGKVFKAR